METARGKQARRLGPAIAFAGTVALLVVAAILFRSPLRSLATFRVVDEYPLYVMHLYGDYQFDEFLEIGILRDADPPPIGQEQGEPWACTCFATHGGESQAILGRNFDWHNRPTLLLFTHPHGSYASVSMVDISYLGFDSRKPSWRERIRLLDAPFLPFDGMNEAGLAVGMMAVPQAESSDDPDKVTIGSLHAIRLLLDNAATVDEAISLLEGYNIDWGGGPPLHYLVADSAGDSAVIEFVGGEVSIVLREEPWQVSTNFTLTGVGSEKATSLCQRYAKVSGTLNERAGNLSQQEAMALLQDVSQSITMWSAVYNMTTGDISVAMGRDYQEIHEFSLRMKGPQ